MARERLADELAELLQRVGRARDLAGPEHLDEGLVERLEVLVTRAEHGAQREAHVLAVGRVDRGDGAMRGQQLADARPDVARPQRTDERGEAWGGLTAVVTGR